MNENPLDIILKNYRVLLNRVDTHIAGVEKRYKNLIACKKGCDSCCRFLTLFPVEALAISQAFDKLPEKTKKKIFKQIDMHKDACPLLIENACALYQARPIICRTHGFPILMEEEGKAAVDFCPENFKGVKSFPKEALLSIEQLNATLLAVNNHFLECIETDKKLPKRVPISQALFMTDNMQ